MHHLDKARIKSLPPGQDSAISMAQSVPHHWCDPREQPPANHTEKQVWYQAPTNKYYC